VTLESLSIEITGIQTEINGINAELAVLHADSVALQEQVVLDNTIPFGEEYTWRVTVINASTLHLNNTKFPTLYLFRGKTYDFDISDNSLTVNNVVLAFVDDAGSLTPTAYTANVSVNGNILTLTVDNTLPSTLYYCNANAHSASDSGVIKIFDNAISSAFRVNQLAKLSTLYAFDEFWASQIASSEQVVAREEANVRNALELLPLKSDFELAKAQIVNRLKSGVVGFDIATYTASNAQTDLATLKGQSTALDSSKTTFQTQLSTNLVLYEQKKTDLEILLNSLNTKKYNIDSFNNTFIWSEVFSGTPTVTKTIASSLGVGTYTISEIVEEIERALNESSQFSYTYSTDIDYASNHALRITATQNNNFQIRFDVNDVFSLLNTDFESLLNTSALQTDYSTWSSLNVANNDSVIKDPVVLGTIANAPTLKVLTVYSELMNAGADQSLFVLLRTLNRATNTYINSSTLALTVLVGDIAPKNVFVSEVYYEMDTGISVCLVCFDTRMILVSANARDDSLSILLQTTGVYDFSASNLGESDEVQTPQTVIDDSDEANIKYYAVLYNPKAKTHVVFLLGLVTYSIGIHQTIAVNDAVLENTEVAESGNARAMLDISSASDFVVDQECSDCITLQNKVVSFITVHNTTTGIYSTLVQVVERTPNTSQFSIGSSSLFEGFSNTNRNSRAFVVDDVAYASFGDTLVWTGRNYRHRTSALTPLLAVAKDIKLIVCSLKSNFLYVHTEASASTLSVADSFISSSDILPIDTIPNLLTSAGFYIPNKQRFVLIHTASNDGGTTTKLQYTVVDINPDTSTTATSNSLAVKKRRDYTITKTDGSLFYFVGQNSNFGGEAYHYSLGFRDFGSGFLHLYCANNLSSGSAKTLLSISPPDFVLDEDDPQNRFTLPKLYFGELESLVIPSTLGTTFVSTNNVFDLLYTSTPDYTDINTSIQNSALLYKTAELKLSTLNDELAEVERSIAVLSRFVTLSNIFDNYSLTINLDDYSNVNARIAIAQTTSILLGSYRQNKVRNEARTKKFEKLLALYYESLGLENAMKRSLTEANARLIGAQSRRVELQQRILFSLKNVKTALSKASADTTEQVSTMQTRINYLNALITTITNQKTDIETDLNTNYGTIISGNDIISQSTTLSNTLGLKQTILTDKEETLTKDREKLNQFLNVRATNILDPLQVQAYTIINLNSIIENVEKTYNSNYSSIVGIIGSTNLINTSITITNINISISQDLITTKLQTVRELKQNVFEEVLNKKLTGLTYVDNIINNDVNIDRIYLQNIVIPNLTFFIDARRFKVNLQFKSVKSENTQYIFQ
jgi:hypothetical protein